MAGAFTTWTALSRSAAKHPHKTALRDLTKSLTYEDIASLVTRICGGLNSLGAGYRTVISIMLDNHVDHGLAWLATGTMGSIEVGLNPQIRGQLLADCLQDSAAEILIVESKYAAEILGVLKDLPALRVLIVREGEEEEEGEANVALSGVEIARWRQLLDDLWPSEHARESPQRLYRPVDLNRRHGICN